MTRSFVLRTAAAVGLLIGFYVFALVVALGLLGLAVAQWTTGLPQNIWVTVACVIAGFTILTAIVPRRIPWEDPGPTLREEDQPELFALTREVAAATEQEMPRVVYLAPDVNASVAHVGGVLGFGGHRVLIVGLPLIQGMTTAQLRAVLAHEFGHYHGGDTRLGPFFARTYDAVARTVSALHEAESWWRKPFEVYGNFFLRVTGSIRRREEFAADRVAARVAGRDAAADALRTVHSDGAAFSHYWGGEFAPLLERGFCAPYLAGFDMLKRSEAGRRLMATAVEADDDADRYDPYDTHPPLAARVAALDQLPDDGSRDDGAPALGLLHDIRRLESCLIDWLVENAELTAIGWDAVPDQVLVPVWRQQVAAANGSFDGVTVASVPEAATSRHYIGKALVPEESHDQLHPQDFEVLGQSALAARLALALYDAGWQLSAPPGEPIVFERGGERVEPFAEVDRLCQGELSGEAWGERVRALGIDGIDLGAPPAGTTADQAAAPA